ncbi:MAG: cyclic-di-AMP receptor [Ruminococcus sp.]|nr:cyclic-di-AMP receptor [Ruminococcus sp.]
MKLVYAIVNNDDTYAVSKGLQAAGIRATKLATTGGFLLKGNTTYMICCQDEQVDNVIGICKEYSKKRKQTVSMSSVMGREIGDTNTVEVTIGGATIFVTDIERFEQV